MTKAATLAKGGGRRCCVRVQKGLWNNQRIMLIHLHEPLEERSGQLLIATESTGAACFHRLFQLLLEGQHSGWVPMKYPLISGILFRNSSSNAAQSSEASLTLQFVRTLSERKRSVLFHHDVRLIRLLCCIDNVEPA